jgi:hypothetical protein
MSNSIFDQLRDAARRAAQDLDERFDLKNKVGQGIDTAGDMARKAEAKINEAAGAARERLDKIDEQYKVTENLRDKAAKAEDAARDVFGAAQSYYTRAEQAYNLGASGARVVEAALGGVEKARAWVRIGSALPNLAVTILGAGAANNWFFHSALPIVGIRKLTEKYNDYLKEQERMLAEGKLDEAERSRIEFQRNLTKYVGAPLLGPFSVAAGASLILGANPLLNGIWFFANGVVCISEGYKFFMIALADQEEVQRVVREIKGLLPA